MATAAKKTEEALYVRNARPNRVAFSFNGVRYPLDHRGHRNDSTALPIEAQNDTTISRWLNTGHLERISRDSFMKLGRRTVDTLPNDFLKRPVRVGKSTDLTMVPGDSDTTRTPSQIVDKDVHIQVRENIGSKWAGELMTTEEELETMDFTNKDNYPSKYRDDAFRKQAGY